MLQMSRRTARPPRTGRPELVGLALVLIAGVATAWWAGGRIQASLDISGLSGFARVLGIFDASQPLRGQEVQGATPVQAQDASQTTAAYCQPGRQPTFELGAAGLQQHLGATIMGTPLECEHPVSGSGDTVQQTTTGLVIYRAATNTVMFTDGWRHWALTPRGLLSWEGSDTDPPAS
jgi:hypothetical protein